LSQVPKIEQRWVCIAATGKTTLAAQLSSYFNEPQTYFALFEFPAADRPFEEVPSKDSYYGQIIVKLAVTNINNCLAKIQPDKIIPDLPLRQIRGKGGLVVIEDRGDVSDISAVNYAVSIDADAVIADAVQREELQSLPRQLNTWAADRSGDALREIRKKVTKRIRGVDFTRYEFATFFTAGLPYGLILENVIPFTHVLNGYYCGVFIANAIAVAALPSIGSALVFSLDEFSSDETRDLIGSLDRSNFDITALIGPGATNDALTNYGSHVPFDLLHICSHGGETDGYFVRQQFADRDGKAHTLEYFEVVSFSEEGAIDTDNVLVERKAIFSTLDGVPWAQRPLSMYPRYVGDDMMQALRDDDVNLKRTRVDIPISLSCHIECYRSFHQGTFTHLGGYSHPIIFNNSCSSSHQLASQFLASGARCYIATYSGPRNLDQAIS
jgi:hypothetical protein